jgi:biotin-(acetyl-CoA carboxylase) ligase
MPPFIPLDPARLAAALGETPIGHTVHYHTTLPSTMTLAHQLAGRPETRSGTLVVAEEQSAGRGQRVRRWEAPAGQALLMSLILKPPLSCAPEQLPMLAGVATLQALGNFVPTLRGQIGLKWPNDLLLGRSPMQGQKVAGILAEASYRQSELQYAIIGVGINVNQLATDLPVIEPVATPAAVPPTSLRLFLAATHGDTADEAPAPLDRTALLITWAQHWAQWMACSPDLLFTAWRDNLWTLGQAVVIHSAREQNSEPFTGRAVTVTAAGNLVVVNDAAVERSFAAGDVSARFVG